MKLLLIFSMMTSMIMPLLNHPLSMGLCLLSQTILVALMTSLMMMNSWFSYILFLIMVGGMMILFMYMTSVASNEKFVLNLKITLVMPATIMLMFIFMPNTIEVNSLISSNEILKELKKNNLNEMFNKFWSPPLTSLFLMTFLYLLLTMIATIKMTSLMKGPLRQMN